MRSRSTHFGLLAGLLALAAVFLTATTASAQTEMTGVRAMGLGEAFTGGPTGNGSLFYNPAGISALMMYSVEGSYVYDQETGRSLVHASIIDGKSNPMLGGGVGYTFSVSGEEANLADFSGHDFYGALSSHLVPGLLMIGITGHYLNHDLGDEDLATGFTLDTGLLLSLGDYISFGAAARDLVHIAGADRDRQMRLGLSYRSSSTHFGFDTVFEFASEEVHTSFNSGLELLLAQQVPVRVGYRYDGSISHHIISGGLGWRSPMVGLDILYRQDVNETDNRMMGLALNIYL